MKMGSMTIYQPNRAATPQPMPTSNTSRPVVEYVIDDLRDRAEAGQRKYGTYLQAHNGRDALIDAYQEALDEAQYLRQLILERDAKMSKAEKRLTAQLLRLASEKFSNHGCNDFDLAAVVPDRDERIAIMRRFEATNSGGRDFDEEQAAGRFCADWVLMLAMAERLEAE
jgi:hypothetical protein